MQSCINPPTPTRIENKQWALEMRSITKWQLQLHLHWISEANPQAKLTTFVQMMQPSRSKPGEAQPSGKICFYNLKISRVHLMPADDETLRNKDKT